jgi:hypothetical protein
MHYPVWLKNSPMAEICLLQKATYDDTDCMLLLARLALLC